MRLIANIFKLAVFLVLLGFALKNADPVTLHYYLGYEWQAPLIVVALVFFAAGVGAGVLASLGYIFRGKKEILLLKRELRAKTRISQSPPRETSEGGGP